MDLTRQRSRRAFSDRPLRTQSSRLRVFQRKSAPQPSSDLGARRREGVNSARYGPPTWRNGPKPIPQQHCVGPRRIVRRLSPVLPDRRPPGSRGAFRRVGQGLVLGQSDEAIQTVAAGFILARWAMPRVCDGLRALRFERRGDKACLCKTDSARSQPFGSRRCCRPIGSIARPQAATRDHRRS